MTTITMLPVGAGRTSAAAPGAVDGPLRLTRRGRAVLFALVALVVALTSVLVSSRMAVADGPSSAPVVERHVVAPGETLWQIAASIARPGEDVRDVVLELAQLNQLPGSGLMAGQTIVLPVEG